VFICYGCSFIPEIQLKNESKGAAASSVYSEYSKFDIDKHTKTELSKFTTAKEEHRKVLQLITKNKSDLIRYDFFKTNDAQSLLDALKKECKHDFTFKNDDFEKYGPAFQILNNSKIWTSVIPPTCGDLNLVRQKIEVVTNDKLKIELKDALTDFLKSYDQLKSDKELVKLLFEDERIFQNNKKAYETVLNGKIKTHNDIENNLKQLGNEWEINRFFYNFIQAKKIKEPTESDKKRILKYEVEAKSLFDSQVKALVGKAYKDKYNSYLNGKDEPAKKKAWEELEKIVNDRAGELVSEDEDFNKNKLWYLNTFISKLLSKVDRKNNNFIALIQSQDYKEFFFLASLLSKEQYELLKTVDPEDNENGLDTLVTVLKNIQAYFKDRKPNAITNLNLNLNRQILDRNIQLLYEYFKDIKTISVAHEKFKYKEQLDEANLKISEFQGLLKALATGQADLDDANMRESQKSRIRYAVAYHSLNNFIDSLTNPLVSEMNLRYLHSSYQKGLTEAKIKLIDENLVYSSKLVDLINRSYVKMNNINALIDGGFNGLDIKQYKSFTYKDFDIDEYEGELLYLTENDSPLSVYLDFIDASRAKTEIQYITFAKKYNTEFLSKLNNIYAVDWQHKLTNEMMRVYKEYHQGGIELDQVIDILVLLGVSKFAISQ